MHPDKANPIPFRDRNNGATKKKGASQQRAAAVRRNAESVVRRISAEKRQRSRPFSRHDRTRRSRLKRSRRFRMRGSASYSYPTHSKQMNHAPKWPTEFRRHVASTHANQRVYGTSVHTLTRSHARRPSRRAGPGQRAQTARCIEEFCTHETKKTALRC